ncbi:MarR family winged helix-turn-helix transcriptional regulator [Streptomyces sp. NPDC001843]|uniref:MarR family winged helix-turn-helix transcriptional regulator n=1 Tax=Streptomyces sp. NPDC001843 TaxID=3364617 RepID=UPI0036C8395B
MRFLARHPGCRTHDIVQEFAITAGGTTKVVDRIEAAGYCRRHPHPDDRRSMLIELPPGVRDLVSGAVKVFEVELRRQIGSAASESARRSSPRH